MKTLSLKRMRKKVLKIATWWIADQTLDHLESIRKYEIHIVLDVLPEYGRVLEIGAGTGWQAQILENRGYDVSAIDLPSSDYRQNRIWPVIDYDGKNIPFLDNTFDIVFSSNVMEHIPHINEFQKEIHRVLKHEGCVIHLLPSSAWRFWTNITHLLKFWTIPKAHGEHAGNALTEILHFNSRWWARLFRETGWTLVAKYSNRLFYTGESVVDARLSINMRYRLSHVLGGSGSIFVLQQNNKT
jgi:SAM-dependent methyltransferase